MTLPFEIVYVPGAQAMTTLQTIAAQNRGYPVLLGTRDDAESMLETCRFSEQTATGLLDEAGQIDAVSWLQQRREEYKEDAGLDHMEADGEWPDIDQPNDRFITHLDVMTGQPHAEVAIAILPAAQSWQTPCFLKYGGWNACPFPAEHASLLRYWQQKYDAKIVAITNDTIEMSVGRPPSSREEALALAREQYSYCPDIVDQGTETLSALASALLNAKVWFFWWD